MPLFNFALSIPTLYQPAGRFAFRRVFFLILVVFQIDIQGIVTLLY